ncbi:hypothetical protein KY290_021888 [Solanum tuberosum]|uniref:Yippee domain-containing protein n=1 Tax=Solanum tuberosum TaxID=4113 RepID=A0ABQ7V4V4_SOLTU|nr:hypothetical protein KY285_020800 [Solanum tuberosum]KAH0693705.1 hypothetical protein KY285_020802 [Solanum tuberosum]KAH0758392.1 hypothetical protein KY290_021885 [Solanum tuberosum]KAH0758395.1 hypothetical protein KY290_021888 [Solanum tuberosum]
MMILKKSKRNPNERIYCRTCRNPVARVQDYIRRVRQGVIIIRRVYNVHVPDDVEHEFGFTTADTYCGQCGTLIGWKFIAVPLGSVDVREGRFMLISREVTLWDGVPLLHLNEEQGLGANEQNANQDLGANEQNANQDLGANEANADGGGNEQNDDQDGGGNEQNAGQAGDANEQDVGANAAVQDGGGNEQNDDQDGGDPMN